MRLPFRRKHPAMAGVCVRAGTCIVDSSSMAKAGYWLFNGWFQLLDESADDGVLGRTVLEALSQSPLHHGIANPRLRSVPNAPILKALGVRSQLAFMKGSRHVGIRRADGHVTFHPYENRGRGGFVEVRGAEFAVEAGMEADPAAVGAAVRRALAVATSGE